MARQWLRSLSRCLNRSSRPTVKQARPHKSFLSLEALEDRFMPAVIVPPTTLDFSHGFASSKTQLTYNGSATIHGTRAELTNSGFNQGGSFFSSSLMNVSKFSTQFNFQLSKGTNIADGITFTIQDSSATALGPGGGGLGYGPDFTGGFGGIPNSVAIKFDLYNNQGEGVDSTGLFVNGAAPTSIGAINLASSGIDLHSGDIFHVNMGYDGTTLTVNIQDTKTGKTAVENYTVNIPATIGSTTAHVGFTGGTGALVATQDILNWTFASSSSTVTAGATRTVVSSNHPLVVAGQAVTFTAQVSSLTPGLGTPTGTVQFRIDGVPFGSPVALHNGSASITTTSLKAGSHTITAIFTSNNSHFSNSDNQASPLIQDVVAPVAGLRAHEQPGDPLPPVDPITHLGSATIDITNSLNVAQSGPLQLVFHLPPGFSIVGGSGTFNGNPVFTVTNSIPASTQSLGAGIPNGTLRIIVTFQAPPGFRGHVPVGQIDVLS